MGKVRIGLVKRVARKLIEMYPDIFTEDFEHNKRVVSLLVEVESKKLRNQIAGYVTRLVKLYKRTGELEMLLERKRAEEAREAAMEAYERMQARYAAESGAAGTTTA